MRSVESGLAINLCPAISRLDLRIAYSMPLGVPRETISSSLLCVADISAIIFSLLSITSEIVQARTEKFAYVPAVRLSARRASLARGDSRVETDSFSNSVRALAKSVEFLISQTEVVGDKSEFPGSFLVASREGARQPSTLRLVIRPAKRIRGIRQVRQAAPSSLSKRKRYIHTFPVLDHDVDRLFAASAVPSGCIANASGRGSGLLPMPCAHKRRPTRHRAGHHLAQLQWLFDRYAMTDQTFRAMTLILRAGRVPDILSVPVSTARFYGVCGFFRLLV